MNAPVAVPELTIDELFRRAVVDYDAVGKIAHGPHMQPETAKRIASEACVGGAGDWLSENGLNANTPFLPALMETAFKRVLDAGWDARDAADQLDFLEDLKADPHWMDALDAAEAKSNATIAQ